MKKGFALIPVLIVVLLFVVVLSIFLQNNKPVRQLNMLESRLMEIPSLDDILNTSEKTTEQVSQDAEWGDIRIQSLDNEISALRSAKYTFDLPFQIEKVSNYISGSSCPVVSYRVLPNNQNYTLFLFLASGEVRSYTDESREVILSNGKQFTRKNLYTDDYLGAIFYRSELIPTTVENKNIKVYWTAYLVSEDVSSLNPQLISDVETLLGLVEIEEYNLTKTVCELRNS